MAEADTKSHGGYAPAGKNTGRVTPKGTSKIRAHEDLGSVPVIALTAHAMSGDREKFLAQGFNEYITKPIVEESVLLDAISRWLKGQG